MKNILCLIGFHNWSESEDWYPNINAPIVTKVTYSRECSRCPKKEEIIMRFDEKTGQPIGEPQTIISSTG